MAERMQCHKWALTSRKESLNNLVTTLEPSSANASASMLYSHGQWRIHAVIDAGQHRFICKRYEPNSLGDPDIFGIPRKYEDIDTGELCNFLCENLPSKVFRPYIIDSCIFIIFARCQIYRYNVWFLFKHSLSVFLGFSLVIWYVFSVSDPPPPPEEIHPVWCYIPPISGRLPCKADTKGCTFLE